jgi:hypothetical protein
VTVKFIGLDVPPPGAGLVTVTASVALEATLDAGMAAVSWVELTNVVTGAAPPKLTVDAASKFVPLIVSVNAAPPATPVFGEIVVIVGAGLDWLGGGGSIGDGLVPPPHPQTPIRATISSAMGRE